MTSNVPATTKSSLPAKQSKDKQKKLINILKDDHHYDIVKEIIDHIQMLKRAKKIKPIEKHRMLMNYNITLLSYCMPKMKIVEDDTKDNSKPFNFQINIGGDPNQKRPVGRPKGSTKKNNVSITIPTKKNDDGSYSVTTDDPTDE
jgi:hypothetical protein